MGDHDIPLVNGQGQVTYELQNGGPFVPQEVVVPIQFTCMAGSPTTNLVASANFAPISDEGLSNPVGPVPRFTDAEDEFPTNQADLLLSTFTSSHSVVPDVDTVVFNFSVQNFGPKDATNVELIDVLPAGLTYLTDDEGCDVANNIVTCNLGTIPENMITQANITASVDTDAAGALVNNASVMSDIPEPTPDPHANFDSATVVVMPDLVITSLTAPNTAKPDGTINISVDVANIGGLPAGPFQLGFFFSDDQSLWLFDPSSTLTCSYPSGLGVGASAGCTGPINLPEDLAPNTYIVFAWVDLAYAVTEADETNNWHIADSGPLSLMVGGCPADLVRENETLTGTQFLEATATATLGPDLIIDGDNIVVRAPTVSILAGTSIDGPFTIGSVPTCP